MTKKVVIDTNREKGQVFRVSESNGRYFVYDVEVGLLSDTQKRIGEARSLQDALEIIKASVRGTVREVRIKDW